MRSLTRALIHTMDNAGISSTAVVITIVVIFVILKIIAARRS